MLTSSTPLLRIIIVKLLVTGILLSPTFKGYSNIDTSFNAYRLQQLSDTLSPESNCSNGVDDNGDGLTDINESHCYFYYDSLNHDCQPTSILWASSSLGIHWINLATKDERLVCPPPEDDFFVDIAWVPNGKLYAACESHKVYEVDPVSWSLKPIEFVSGYRPNGMTADGSGMLYFTAYNGPETCDVLKIDPLTNTMEKIVRLSDYGLLASGDCCFLNGNLYVSCNGYIARVDISTRLVVKLVVDNINFDDSWGITTLGDGYLYVSNNTSSIYRLDPVTMKGTLVARFNQPDMLTTGFASYVDACNAPCSKPAISLGADTAVCKNGTLLLSASGDLTISSYLWNNGGTQKTNMVDSPGIYWVEVANGCETNSDTIFVGSSDKPSVSLAADTLICTQTSIVLQNLRTTQLHDRFLWSDNSGQQTYTVKAPGSYWLTVSNVCGSVTDTIHILRKVDSCECSLYIPGAFSPNNDQLNDVFQLSSRCLIKGNFKIFNRWGQLVYSNENLYAGWDGRRGGKLQSQGTYVYVLQFSYLDRPGTFMRKGSVMLLR